LIATGIFVVWPSSAGENGTSSSVSRTARKGGVDNSDRAPGTLAAPTAAGTAQVTQVHVGPGWPADRARLKAHTLHMETVEKTLLSHAFKPTGKKYDGKNEWLGFQIKEIDWILEPFARAHYDVQQAVYANCSFESIKNGQKAHSGQAEPTWNCPAGTFPCPHCTPPSQPAAFSHVHMGEDIKWYGMDGLDLFIYLAFFASPDRPRGGRFLEVGNYDGLDNSNTVFFENTLGWTGVLFEPTTCADKYAPNRRARTVKGALCATPGYYLSDRYADCGAANVTCQPLLAWSPETEYDFMSIDVESLELPAWVGQLCGDSACGRWVRVGGVCRSSS